MNSEELREFCLGRNKNVKEDFPFDESTLVFKIGGKIFALMPLDKAPDSINLKCDPERAVELRETYKYIIPGYHMNKKHWNTIVNTSSINRTLLEELIKHSYQLVVNSLPGKIRKEL